MVVRKGLSWLHRWVSLMAGLVLVVLGLSGSVLVWQAELDAALNPAWFRPLPSCSTDGTGRASGIGEPGRQPTASEPSQALPQPASAPRTETVARVLAILSEHAPGRQAGIVVAPREAGAAFQVWERRDKQGIRREHFIDVDCGRYLGSRDRGEIRWDGAHLVPTLYELHRYFWSGEGGATVAGIGGLVLFGLGLTGLVLVWPRHALRLDAWRRVLTIRWDSAPARRWYDVHRTVGLWLLPVLLLVSLTGAALVFGNTARAWVSAVLPTQADGRMARAKMPQPASSSAPAQNVRETAEASASNMRSPDEWVALAQQQFPAARWSRLTLPVGSGPVEVRLLQPGEPRADTGNTRVRLSAQGALLQRYDPLTAPAGNVVLNWLFPLHSAEAFGVVLRLLWSLFGLVPTLLLGTGLWLWWRRRRAATQAAHAARSRAATRAAPSLQ